MKISGIILAAGLGTRMGGSKMRAQFKGKPMVQHVIDAAKGSNLAEIIVVTGHETINYSACHAEFISASQKNETLEQVQDNERGSSASTETEISLKFTHNPDYAKGLSTSLKVGLKAISGEGALILLGDMPLINSDHINAMIVAFQNSHDIIVPICKGEQGNPILWGKNYYEAFETLQGDKGAKPLLKEFSAYIKYIELDEAILRDFDTQESLSVETTARMR